jgi:hypothetical protein
MEIADKIPDISAVTAKFTSLGAYTKAVELALYVAEKVDEDNLAEDYSRNLERPDVSHMLEVIFTYQ